MATYRQTRDLRDVDAAYIAGLVDGEGTLALSRKHGNENRQLALTISNTDRALLDSILEVVGSGKITAKRVSHPIHTPSFTYAVYNRQALALLEQIEPYLRTYKRERAHLILRDYLRLTPRNGKYTAAMRREREAFEREVQSITPSGRPVESSRGQPIE